MAFKVTLDIERCQGYANCLIEGPSIFDFDDDTNVAILRNSEPDESLRAQAAAAARGCPARAITLEDV